MQQDDDKQSIGKLFQEELVDLRREIMVLGLIVPLMVLSYVGLVVSYQKPFLDNLDMRVPSICAIALLLGLICLILNRSYSVIAIRLAAWGTLCIALIVFCTGQDAYTGIGVIIGCGAVALLIGGISSWISIVICSVTLSIFAVSHPELRLWPAQTIASTIGCVMVVILSQVVSRVLFRALKWTQENYVLARQQTDNLGRKSTELALALKSLGQTSFQLARTNEQMEVAVRYAEEARQSKQQFAAAVSHELRAPLNLIIGFSDLVLNEPDNYNPVGNSLPPKLLSDIRVVNKHAQHLLKLVNDILDLSQMDVNYLTLSRAPTQIGDVIESAVNDYAYLAEQRGLSLAVDIEGNLPRVNADGTRIRQVLLNLLNNAMKVTEHGRITVHAKESYFIGNASEGQSAPSQREVIVSVHDTGIGIASQDIQRIFEPFVQVGDFNLRSGGSGLGLAISRRFVDLHGGRMWVESEPGVGSTFYFSVPVVAETLASSITRTPLEFRRREVGSLVVVERHAVLSRLIERHVEGIRVETVQSVDELRAESAPEVVLINEPVTSLSELQPLPEALSRIPVFRCYVHSALVLPASENDNVDNSSHQYLIKPVKRELLYTTLSQMLAQRVRLLSMLPGRSARILIVEDEEDASYLLSRMLYLAPPDVLQGFEGVSVVKARSVEVAIEYLSELSDPLAEPIDAILLDLALGKSSGYAVLAEMDKRPWLHDLPVCVITGQVAGGDLLVTPYVTFTRKSGLSARELAQAIVALTRIALPGVDVKVR